MSEKKLTVLSVFGTRPEAIKMAPLVAKLKEDKDINSLVCVTAQHRQMLDQVMDTFSITADFDLDIMRQGQTLSGITTAVLRGLDEVIKKAAPDIVLVHGDTTTTFAASLAAFYNRTTIGHVEAGLRTFDKYSPYPEEANRRLTDSISDLFFAPTAQNRQNLLNEGINKNIYVTGNTVIDAIKTTARDDYTFARDELNNIDYKNRRVILVTAHRRENWGAPLQSILKGLRDVACAFPEAILLYPVHLNPVVRDAAHKALLGIENVILTEPLDVLDIHNIMRLCYMVITDSGGLQEEAPSLGKPVLVMRNETERPEALEAGTVALVGSDSHVIFNAAKALMQDEGEYQKMARAVNPYGDGFASDRIVKAIRYHFGLDKDPAKDFTPGD